MASTSAIIGPHSLEQLDDLIAGFDVALTDEIFDRIDEIVPPGSGFNDADRGYTPPSLEDAALRRR